ASASRSADVSQKAGDTDGGSARRSTVWRSQEPHTALAWFRGRRVPPRQYPGALALIWSFLPGSGKGHSSCPEILAACNAERHRLYTPHVYASCPFRHSRHWRADASLEPAGKP